MKKIVYIMLVLLLAIGSNAMASGVGDQQISGAQQDGTANSQSGSEALAGAQIEDNSVTIINDRKFINPGVIPMAHTNGFFTTPTPDSSFRSIQDILYTIGVSRDTYCIVVSKGVLKEWAKGGDSKPHLQIVRGHDQVQRVYDKEFEGVQYLYIAVERPLFDDKGELVGTQRDTDIITTALIDNESDDADTNSLQVIGKAGLKALADGNNYMVIINQGHHRMVEASGWGVGFYTAGGDVSESGKVSRTIGGGTGYSKNRTTPEDKPWIHGYVGVKDMPYPPQF